MHIYFTRNRGEIMKQNKKIAITHYISIRFSAIIFIMAIIMILFISYFSNKTIYFDIRRQIRKETRYDFLNIDVRNGKILVNKNFIFEEDHVQKIILDSQGVFFRGHYPDKKLKNIPVNQWHFQKVKCSSDYYYIYDRPYLKKDTITNKRVLVIVRNIGKASDFDSQYKTMKYISYTFTFVIAFIGFLLIGIVSSRLTIPMKKIKDTADKIGTDGDLAKRIEYTTPFKELDAMIQANNRMMDRLEDLFQQQQQFTSDVAHELRTPLNLPDTVDGYPFEITYELAEDGYIRLDGSINEEEQAKLKRGETYRTYIVVTARYGEYRKSKKYEIRIVPKKNISQTNVFYKIQQYLKKEEQENRYSRDIKIPSVYKDIEITKRQENQGGISGILILFVTVCIFIPLHNYLKLQEEGKKCQEQAERDFPVIVHLLTLYMGAGLSFFSAVKRISQNYQKQRELDDSKKYAFEKMMRMEQQMSNGVSQREACQDWGMQFRTDSYQKLSLILIQSFTKGGREAAMLMEAEEREAFHKRIDRAKKEGEEASTRLLFPMILLLCQVMLLVMYPALTRFQGF